MNWVSKRSAADERSATQRRSEHDAAASAPAFRRYFRLVAPLAIAIALTAVVLSGLTTARGRIAASTGTQSLLTAGQIDLVIESGSDGAVQQLLFDEDGLYPGKVLHRCLVVSYRGSIDSAAIRLYGHETGGTGLSAYLDMTIERGSGTDPACRDFAGMSTMYSGRLDTLLTEHSTFATGLRVAEPAFADQTTTLRVRIEVVDDNDAQDRTTRFMVLFEVRP
jgi:hypothetical protein